MKEYSNINYSLVYAADRGTRAKSSLGDLIRQFQQKCTCDKDQDIRRLLCISRNWTFSYPFSQTLKEVCPAWASENNDAIMVGWLVGPDHYLSERVAWE